MSSVLSKEKNVLGGPLLACSYAPLPGFSATAAAPPTARKAWRTWCASSERGIPRVQRSRATTVHAAARHALQGLHPGDRWCLHVAALGGSLQGGHGAQVVLESTHETC